MKRVLIVTYDFPPVGGSGVQRVLKFAKYLPRFGWQPTILTTTHGRPIPRDPTLTAEIEHIEVHRTPSPHPYRIPAVLKRVLRRHHDANRYTGDMDGGRKGPWHPTAWLVPDGKLVWIPFGAAWALLRNRKTRSQVVLSTVPTPTAAVLGSLIARAWRVPHVIDYRDPWTGAFYLPRRFRMLDRLESNWEARILRRASAAVIVPGVRELLPDVQTPIRMIHNGYDEDDFAGVRPRRPGNGFVIAHLGLLWRGRDLGPVTAACERLAAYRPDLASRIHFFQAGRVDRYVSRQFSALREHARVTVVPPLPHAEAIAYMLGADLLYLPTSHDCLPGKTYEYLRSGTPILGLGARNSHLHRLLAETGGGEVIRRDDSEAIAAYIERIMTGDARSPEPVSAAVARYSREATARALAQLLDGALKRQPA
jgi:glycosyltransferase involved in cell wall biosynthesis